MIVSPAANCGSSPFSLALTARASADLASSCFQLVYFLRAVFGGGFVVGESIATGGDAVAITAVEPAAALVVDFAFPLIFLLVGVIFRGAPLLRFFSHPMMSPSSLAWRLVAAFRGMTGVSVLLSWVCAFDFVIAMLN